MSGNKATPGSVKLTDEELERMAIEELLKESTSPPGSQKRKKLDVAAHRMLVNSLSASSSKRSRGNCRREKLADQERKSLSGSGENDSSRKHKRRST